MCCRIYIIILGLTGLIACNRTQKGGLSPAVLSDTTALAHQVDSGSNMAQDGLDYLPLNTGTYDQLPPDLTAILNLKHAGWALPPISKKYLKKLDRTAQGPYFIHEDLNDDKILDYVVQFRVKDTTTLAAYMMQETGKPREYILEKHCSLTHRPELILSKEPKGKRIKLKTNNSEIKLLQHAVVANSSSGLRRYLFQEGKFVAFSGKP